MSNKTPNPTDRAIGANVRKWRMLRGMSQEKLGDGLGLTFQQVQKYEKGTNRIGGSRMVQICNVLGIDRDKLFEGIPAEGDNRKAMDIISDPFIDLSNKTWGIDLARSLAKLPPQVQHAISNLCGALAKHATS
jgi:transcriptional regulator with XRE-family HTH domain